MTKITLNTLKKTRINAQSQINEKGYLGYIERCEFLNLTQHNPKISKKFNLLVWIFMEVHCAYSVAEIWRKNTEQVVSEIPLLLLQIAYHNFITNNASHPISLRRISRLISDLLEDVNDYEWNDDVPSRYFKYTKQPREQSEKYKILSSLYAIEKAVSTFSDNKIPFAEEGTKDSDWLGEKDPTILWSTSDFEVNWAADWAAIATDLSPKKFWTWYIGDCLSQALKDAQKYFPDL